MSFFGDLFSNKENTVDDCILMVQNFMKNEGISETPYSSDKYAITWIITRGSAIIHIWVIKSQNDNEIDTIRIFSPIINLPENNILPLYRKCLELNMTLLTCGFAVFKDQIVVVNERPIDGLDQNELAGNISYLSYVADEWDDELANEFDATLASSE